MDPLIAASSPSRDLCVLVWSGTLKTNMFFLMVKSAQPEGGRFYKLTEYKLCSNRHKHDALHVVMAADSPRARAPPMQATLGCAG